MKIGALIVPTGIGASIGGFAGDASKWARKLADKCKLIVNPNVVNAACFSGITENMLYVEGYSLDQFFKKQCSLEYSKNNKIGVVFDKAIPQKIINVHINTINAVKTVYDIDIIYQITDEEVGVEFFIVLIVFYIIVISSFYYYLHLIQIFLNHNEYHQNYFDLFFSVLL